MYPIVHIAPDDKMLIVAPHPDDETIGCGGVLAMYGQQCDVLLITDGRLGIPEGSDLSTEETAAIRKEEFKTVMDSFGVNNYWMLNIPDGEAHKHAKQVSSVDLRVYDLIFVPNRNERHPDHKAAYEIVKRLCRKQCAKADLVEYEVWSPLISANRFLDISDIMDIKINNLLVYRSQISSIDYEVIARGLNMYRGAPHHVAYCEAFFSNAADRRLKKQQLFEMLPERLRKIILKTAHSIRKK